MDLTENATPPKSTQSKKSNISVQIPNSTKVIFEFAPRVTPRKLSFSIEWISGMMHCHHVTPVAGSIFEPLSQTHISKRVFMNEISSSPSLDIQLTLFCVCGVDSFVLELEHL